MIVHRSGGEAHRVTFPAIDVLRGEQDAFADAIEQRRSYPVPEAEVLATLSAFEAALQSMAEDVPMNCRED